MKDLNYALMLMKDGKLDLAKDMLVDLLKTDPQNQYVLFNLGMCYCELENPEKAIRTLSECVEHSPNYSNAYVALGYAHSMLRQNGPARENFAKALEIDPENSYALKNLGNLYGMEENYDRAIECFEKSFAIDPADQQTAYGIGYAYLKIGKPDMAEKYLIAALDLDRSTQIAEMAMELLRDLAENNP